MDTNKFVNRHVGINQTDEDQMLSAIGVKSTEELIKQTIPNDILLNKPIDLPEAMTERELEEHMLEIGSKNKLYTSYIGQGWYDTITPGVIRRGVLESSAWYTSYTPYQAEVSQGRLEALFNFQNVITELTGMELTNCSLLDEATAGAEAVMMMYNERPRAQAKAGATTVFVDDSVFETTKAVIRTRLIPQGMKPIFGDYRTLEFTDDLFAVVVQYPNAKGSIEDYRAFVEKAHAHDAKVAVAADLLSLALLTPPAEWGADIVFGSSQRFGIPMYNGGPSAGYVATSMTYKRVIPGRIIGISKDAYGHPAFRLALQTREQHIKRERATSNICTAQALLASMAGFYAVYHGPKGLRHIAHRVHSYAGYISEQLNAMGYKQLNAHFFDTLLVELPAQVGIEQIRETAEDCGVNFCYHTNGTIGISLDETTLSSDLGVLLYIFSSVIGAEVTVTEEISTDKVFFGSEFVRTSDFLIEEVFNSYHTETELMRYIKRLERKDISLAHSMIPLGSCTMKLNAAAELITLSMPQFGCIHPLAPADQREGYIEMIDALKQYLGVITGLPAVSLQPNSGASGEYAGLRTIRNFLEQQGQGHRDIIILPASAHGTNPASASQCGYKTVIVDTDERGNVDMADFIAKIDLHKDSIAAMMITYPSTHGIFETNIIELCQRIHNCGGLVYMDGANMNAQVAFTNPGFIGADVCHLNLHKTFAIPHGGGGPGVGPICATEALKPFLPEHIGEDALADFNGYQVSSSPDGSAGILAITYSYIRMLGSEGLHRATEVAILNANYMAARLKDSFGIVYTGATGRVGHELILECRKVKEISGIDESDIAKRLMDFGYHAPTLSFPVHGTLMVEPTESESKAELDRFIDVMNCIWEEIQEIVRGQADPQDNVLKNAPHPEYEIVADEWTHAYPRSKACYPLPYLRENKFWVNVARIDNGYGDRNLQPTFCSCQL